MSNRAEDSTHKFESALKAKSREKYILRLYVSEITTSKSIRAIENIKKICKENLEGRYELEVIDIRKNPKIAQTENIIASPTLIRKLPPPLRGIIGDMVNEQQVLIGLDLIPNKKKS